MRHLQYLIKKSHGDFSLSAQKILDTLQGVKHIFMQNDKTHACYEYLSNLSSEAKLIYEILDFSTAPKSGLLLF
jgi:hypothetical protein